MIGSAALAAGTAVTTPFLLPKYHSDQRPKQSRVAILHAQQYSDQLDQVLAAGLSLFPLNVQGKTVVLKPNLVDYVPGNAINTHPLLVLAAAESFRRMGAKSVVVAEGPGLQRDTQLVLFQSGYQQSLRDERIQFVDLNRDELIRIPLRASYTGMRDLWLPRTVLEIHLLTQPYFLVSGCSPLPEVASLGVVCTNQGCERSYTNTGVSSTARLSARLLIASIVKSTIVATIQSRNTTTTP
jgi:Domain of unknown function (DUF362)